MKKGNLSINSENILPIIKKWLYSDSDIFIRELVSNSCDAINKLKKLATMGEATLKENEKFSIRVVLDKENKTIQIIDNGIGMTADEIEEYITQIAFSGASDFVNKYKDIYLIVINWNISKEKKVKTILHEFAHIELHHIDRNSELYAFSIENAEDEADKYIDFLLNNIKQV